MNVFVWVYVCGYWWVCICVSVYGYECVYVQSYVYLCQFLCVCANVCYVSIWVHVCVWAHACVWVNICVVVCVYIYMIVYVSVCAWKCIWFYGVWACSYMRICQCAWIVECLPVWVLVCACSLSPFCWQGSHSLPICVHQGVWQSAWYMTCTKPLTQGRQQPPQEALVSPPSKSREMAQEVKALGRDLGKGFAESPWHHQGRQP